MVSEVRQYNQVEVEPEASHADAGDSAPEISILKNPPLKVRFSVYEGAEVLKKRATIFGVAKTHQWLFGAEPWNEYMRCQSCGSTWGWKEYRQKEDNQESCCIEEKSTHMHPVLDTTQRLIELASRKDQSFLMAVAEALDPESQERKTLGYIWGYEAPLGEVVEDILKSMQKNSGRKLTDGEYMLVGENIINNYADKIGDYDGLAEQARVFYIEETGVKRGARRTTFLDLITQLGEVQMKRFSDSENPLGSTSAVLWTTTDAATHKIFSGKTFRNLTGAQILYKLDHDFKDDKREIMHCDFATFARQIQGYQQRHRSLVTH